MFDVLRASLCAAAAVCVFQDAPVEIRQALAIPSVGRYGRAPFHTDAVEALLVAGKWTAPAAGDAVQVPGGPERRWQDIRAGADGWFTGGPLGGGYVSARVESPSDRIAVLEAAGHGVVYVNGEPRAGDPYATGAVRLPVRLRPGTNELLFQVGRGRLRARLVSPAGAAALDGGDTTLPDLVEGSAGDTWGALPLISATNAPLRGAVVAARVGQGVEVRTRVGVVPPLGVRKVGFRIKAGALKGVQAVPLRLRLLAPGAAPEPLRLDLRVRTPAQTRKVTFLSAIDGSVQYYAVNPASTLPGGRRRPALVLTLHGASVEAIGQADSYSPKSWAHIVAPTNRRPYGFDWEDWGRLDAIEVLEHAARTLNTDPARVYLTGHSMGGHGAWIVGATYPDRFAAIGPSAGWVSFASYGGSPRGGGASQVETILTRAASPHRTLDLLPNLSGPGIYVLHGDADDNVPVTEARAMRMALTEAGVNPAYHEQPGAGHWWDASDEPGADCTDWAPMFDLFARRVLPTHEERRDVTFATASPGVSASSGWVTIEGQQRAMEPSRVSIRWDPLQRRFRGETSNVSALRLSLAHAAPGKPVKVELDGVPAVEAPWPVGAAAVRLARTAAGWAVAAPADTGTKGPHRYGPFKEAFNRRFVLVYGTRGTEQENAWSLARARLDAETWWVRGNGSVDVAPDTDSAAWSDRARSVVLYGNADTNGAWEPLMGASPVTARRGAVAVGERTLEGVDLACLVTRPRPGSADAMVAAVSGSGIAGMRLTDRLSTFVSGAAYPDWVVFGPDVLERGPAAVRAAGFFAQDWALDAASTAWRE